MEEVTGRRVGRGYGVGGGEIIVPMHHISSATKMGWLGLRARIIPPIKAPHPSYAFPTLDVP